MKAQRAGANQIIEARLRIHAAAIAAGASAEQATAEAKKLAIGCVYTRKTPCAAHPYSATLKHCGTYGWGNSPVEARQCLYRNLAKAAGEKQYPRNAGQMLAGLCRALEG